MSLILEIILLIFSPLAFFAILALRKNGYWRRRGIPGPKPSLIKGNLDAIFGDHSERLQLWEWSKQFGRVYGIQQGWNNVLITSEPDMVHQLVSEKFEFFHGRHNQPLDGDVDKTPQVNMLSAQGIRWKRLRSIANPAFSVTNLKRVMPIIEDSIQVTMDLLGQASYDGKPINLHPYFLEMTLDVIARIALGQQESCQFRSEYSELVKNSFKRFNNNPFDYVGWQFPWLGRNVLRPFIKLTGKLRGDSFQILINKLAKTVQQRKQQREAKKAEDDEWECVNGGKKRVDFIDLFLDAESEDFQLQSENGTFNKMDKFEKKNTPEEIVMNCVVFLLAGYDTTSNSLSLVCHNMALHPEVQERLREEIEAICVDEEPTYEQLSRLKYTEAVVHETLRLCPIAGFNRICAQTTTLGNYTIEKGSAVAVDTFTLHRDKRIWGEDAEDFRPERWFDEGRTQQSNAFYGFGGGPRICIGMRLAMMEEKIALVHLLRRFTIRRCAQTEDQLRMSGQVVLNPESVTVELEPCI